MKIVFFGSGPYVLSILETLRTEFELVLVLTTEKGKHETVSGYCIKNKIAYIPVSSFSDPNLTSLILDHKSSIAVLAYFGLILPKEILNIFPKGILNIHPSLLPKYRGPTPGQSAILHGEKETGVTLIKLDEEVDHGLVVDMIREPIESSDTSETLYRRLFASGAKLLEKNIKPYLDNKITLVEQDHKKATFTDHLTRQSGYFDIDIPPSSEKLDQMIRAYYPWPTVWTRIKINDSGLKIIKFLPEKKIQVEGKNPMSYKDFLNGYPAAAKEMYHVLSIQY